ncbi:hypothetical protein MCAP1_000233 [Malassezia caprae]|uniref:Uncharacterized protein n=1 Tax=Malassezia caprae TaxID=1381934 RepID=A0AAF0ITS6_9BASI|nr:hypothetical protein MCAP1_000233 [Malassezia caprae]
MASTMATPPKVRHESNATVTMGYSAVSFVPTEHVQTAVSDFGDHIVIDTIIPPARYLPPTLSVAKLAGQIQDDLVRELEGLGLGMGSRVASVAHPRSKDAEAEQFVRTPKGQLVDLALQPRNEQYSRARLGIRSLRGEPLLTYFPDPKGAEPVLVHGVPTTCPCVCCRSGCAGADPATGKLALLPEALAKDAAGNILVDVPPEPSSSQDASGTTLGEPFTEAKKAAAPALVSAPIPEPVPTATPAPPVRTRIVPVPPKAPVPPSSAAVQAAASRIQPVGTMVKPVKSLGDLRGYRATAPTLPTPASLPPVSERPLPPGPPTSAQAFSSAQSRITVRPPGGLQAGVPPVPVREDVPSQRAEKGMSVFAPLQMSEELRHALTLNDLSSLSLSPEGGRRTPPLSSPSSMGSTPRYQGSRGRPNVSPIPMLDTSATPIAARYCRSVGNLRQKAREDLPPLPPLPKDMSVPAPTRVRIVSGHAR